MSEQTIPQDTPETANQVLPEFPEPAAVPAGDDAAAMGSFAGIQADEGSSAGERAKKLDLLYDLNLPVSIELGRTNMLIRDILDLKRGSIVEFEKMTSEPVDILINGKKMAEGEVVVIEKHFGIRITNLIDAADRVKGLGK
jgi:flagellar motor switch protein FliN